MEDKKNTIFILNETLVEILRRIIHEGDMSVFNKFMKDEIYSRTDETTVNLAVKYLQNVVEFHKKWSLKGEVDIFLSPFKLKKTAAGNPFIVYFFSYIAAYFTIDEINEFLRMYGKHLAMYENSVARSLAKRYSSVLHDIRIIEFNFPYNKSFEIVSGVFCYKEVDINYYSVGKDNWMPAELFVSAYISSFAIDQFMHLFSANYASEKYYQWKHETSHLIFNVMHKKAKKLGDTIKKLALEYNNYLLFGKAEIDHFLETRKEEIHSAASEIGRTSHGLIYVYGYNPFIFYERLLDKEDIGLLQP
jgi:hypothetical protein